MVSATLRAQLSTETKLLGYLYPAALVLGICAAFVSAHTNFKIVTTESHDPAVSSQDRALAAPAKRILPPELAIWEFGFPEPSEAPAPALVSDATIKKNASPVPATAEQFFFARQFQQMSPLFPYAGSDGSQAQRPQPLDSLAFQTAQFFSQKKQPFAFYVGHHDDGGNASGTWVQYTLDLDSLATGRVVYSLNPNVVFKPIDGSLSGSYVAYSQQCLDVASKTSPSLVDALQLTASCDRTTATSASITRSHGTSPLLLKW